MMIRKAFKFKLKPNTNQKIELAKTAGCVRFLWNRSLFSEKASLDNGSGFIKYASLCKSLTDLKKRDETKFLKEAHSQALQQCLKDLDRAVLDGLKKKKGFPKFKKKNQHDSFRYPQGVKLNDNKVFLPKIGWIKYFKSAEVIGTIKNTTVSKYCGHWYVSFQVEQESTEVLSHTGSEIGVDLGIKRLITLSNGQYIAPVNAYKKYQKNLKRAQKALSRRKKSSNNRRKQIFKVQKIHKKISDLRKDTAHKISDNLTKNHSVIYIEDLQVSNMSKSAKGTVEEHGKNVKAKSGLNRSILDQGWHELRRQLEYKASWRGAKVIAINPKYTSQKCPVCKTIDRANRQSQENFLCISCGYSENADVVGARNILAAGQAVSACGDISLATG